MRSALRQFLAVGLLFAAILALFVAAESGQRQLAEASRRVEAAAQRASALSGVLQLVRQAESAQRGYILLGDSVYLDPYQQAADQIGPALLRLEAAFAHSDPSVQRNVAAVHRLAQEKFAELRESIDLYRQRGRSAAIAMIRTDVGERAMSQIAALAASIQAQETDNMLQVSRSWRSGRWVNLGMRSAALIATLFLVVWLRRLIVRYVYSKERQAAELAERQAQLERIVQRRTEDLSELSTQLQSVAERERAALSRELHDELGGLLVAARMDVTWLEEKLASDDPAVQAHFKRVHDALVAGVDLKRRVVEELRPTLLDNLGLWSALRWQIAETCARGKLSYTERYPSSDLRLTPEASIAIFRIVQEALTNVLRHARAKSVELLVEEQGESLLIRIRDDGIGIPLDRRRTMKSHGLAAMRHRAQGLGGGWYIARRTPQGTELQVRLPLKGIQTAAPALGAESASV